MVVGFRGRTQVEEVDLGLTHVATHVEKTGVNFRDLTPWGSLAQFEQFREADQRFRISHPGPDGASGGSRFMGGHPRQ